MEAGYRRAIDRDATGTDEGSVDGEESQGIRETLTSSSFVPKLNPTMKAMKKDNKEGLVNTPIDEIWVLRRPPKGSEGN